MIFKISKILLQIRFQNLVHAKYNKSKYQVYILKTKIYARKTRCVSISNEGEEKWRKFDEEKWKKPFK